MDISGCKMAFPDSELRRVLPEKLFELYEQIRQRRDIELAELEGLEECPFCDYKVVVDVDFQTDKVLRCQNEECGKVSCRRCKKEVRLFTHSDFLFWDRLCSIIRTIYLNLVKVCCHQSRLCPHANSKSEMEEDKKLDGKHAIEEAMSMYSSCFV